MAKYIVVHSVRVCTEFTPETYGRLTTLQRQLLHSEIPHKQRNRTATSTYNAAKAESV